MIHKFNWPRKHHTIIAPWRTWRKAMITFFLKLEISCAHRYENGDFTIINI